jgi:hypothetical protein
VLRGRLCRHLVHLRGTATQSEVAAALGWAPSKLVRIENATTGISTTDLRALLAHYRVANPALIDMLVYMARESRHPVANPYTDVLAPEMVTYLRYEGSASMIRQYHPYLIPGLLQTEEYARAVITALAEPGTDPTVIDRQVKARLVRQGVLSAAQPAHAHFILDEAALRRPVGAQESAGLMRRQIDHIVTMSDLDHISVQVLPFAAGLCRGAQWPFVLLDFADDDAGAVLYLEGSGTRITRDNPDEISAHEFAFRELSAAAIAESDRRLLTASLLGQR